MNKLLERIRTMLLSLVTMLLAFTIQTKANSTVVEVVVNSENHTILEAAVVAAGLVETLSGEGPFTIFAPTDAAFEALPEGTVETLLEDPSGLLTQILLYHAVAGKVMSTDLSDGMKATTVQGQEITVTITDGKVFINDAQVIVANIEAGNGVVHVIDAVLIPETEEPMPATVVDIVVNSEVHNTLEAAVIAAGLAETLSGTGPFTIFAPTDAAFEALPEGTVETLLEDPSGLLTQILLYHAVAGKVMSTDLSNGMKATTVQGQEITVTITDGKVFINDAQVIVADIVAGNGVVHVIDVVLIPAPGVKISEHQNLGKIITDTNGMTLYFLSRDAKDFSNCTGTCLENWPVFYNPGLMVGEGLNADDFGTIVREDGMKQTTYKGWPLYYYIHDINPGQAIGEGRSNTWFAAKPDYTIMLVNNQLVGNDGKNYKGDYTAGYQIIQYFTDDRGRTLYTWTRDFFNTNKFTRQDFSNNGNWPVYEEDNIVVPSTLDASLFSSIDVHGRKQMTYKGWPLYYFGADGNVRGNTKGVSVPSPGIWPVARQNMEVAKPATVVDIVVNSEAHNILEAAFIAAGLAETLSGTGPFTIFAPTDAAFEALPEGTVETLLQDPSGLLTQILLYHAVAGKVMSTDLSNGMKATTVQGQEITVTITDGKVFINDAQVIVADIVAGNGVVHVIDVVLMPKPMPATVVDIVVNSEAHNILEAAVIAAGLAETLSGTGPFTIFAPTDAAFEALPEGTVETLLQDPSGLLTQILLYHAVAGKVMSTDLSDGMKATTVQAQEITVTITDGKVFINDAQVIVADIEAGNGVVHVIDVVLIPETTTNVTDISGGETMFSMYPNPASSTVTFDLRNLDTFAPATLSIYSMDGRMIRQMPAIDPVINYDVRDLKNGLYIVVLKQNNRISTEKLIVR
ncbi:MAG: fasciclin domain-containing protein [Bacteroidota bacterium]